MIVPAVGTQDSRITSDLPFPKQPSKKKKKKRDDFGFKVTVSHQKPRMDPLIMLLEISERWIRML